MDAPELSHAAALIAKAFVERGEAQTPEEAARVYFRCLNALVATAQEHEDVWREAQRIERQPKPWDTPKKSAD